MGEISIEDIEISTALMANVTELSLRHYGSASDASCLRVTEVALELYFLWLDLMEGGENEIEAPITNWEFGDGKTAEQLSAEIRGWLFKGR